MTRSALLRRVKEAYPGAFESLPKAKLKLVESAVLYASGLNGHIEALSAEESLALKKEAIGKPDLTPGDRITGYRAREDLTQTELAKLTGISQANISAMERGRRPIGLEVAKKLAKVLKCDYRQLV
jgi:DNA-binding XRE family transcriptional regulator